MTGEARLSPPAWSRFTILDGLLLIVAFAIATGRVSSEMKGTVGLDSLRSLTIWSLRSGLAGMAWSGLVVLGSHWLRGRRDPLSWGEKVWLVPPTFSLLERAAWTILGDTPGMTWLIMRIFFGIAIVEIILAILSARWIVLGALGRRRTFPCRWTDTFGATTSILMGIWLVFPVLQSLGWIA